MTNKQWKIVLVDATDEMVEAGFSQNDAHPELHPTDRRGLAGDVYGAMLSAAPEPDEELVERVVDAINHTPYSSIPELARVVLKEIGRQTDD